MTAVLTQSAPLAPQRGEFAPVIPPFGGLGGAFIGNCVGTRQIVRHSQIRYSQIRPFTGKITHYA